MYPCNLNVMVIAIVIGALEKAPKGLVQNYSNYNIVEIGQNTEKSPGDPRGLSVTQTSVKNMGNIDK